MRGLVPQTPETDERDENGGGATLAQPLFAKDTVFGGSVSGRTDLFSDSYCLAAGFFRGFSRRIFSPHLGEEKNAKKKQVINFRFAASISWSLSTPVPILWRMHLQEYQCVGMVSLFLIFLSRVVAWSFIFWNDHHQWQTIAEDFQIPYSFMISSSYFFDKRVPSTVLLE